MISMIIEKILNLKLFHPADTYIKVIVNFIFLLIFSPFVVIIETIFFIFGFRICNKCRKIITPFDKRVVKKETSRTFDGEISTKRYYYHKECYKGR